MQKKMRKQISGVFNPWNFSLDAGQRVIDQFDTHIVYDLYESFGYNKSSSGELSYRKVKKPHPNAEAVCIKGIWFWKW